MKIVIVSNYVNQHTMPLCWALYARLGEDFAFVETRPREADPEAFQMGYAYYLADGAAEVPWLVRGWQQRDRAARILLDADAVLTANADDSWVMARLRAGKLTFRTHERWYRAGLPWYRRPRAILGGWLHHGRFRNLHLLCASAYAASDASRVGCFRGKAYRWGYFPEFRAPGEQRGNPVPVILWAGRMVDWKHGDDALSACALLAREGYRFRLRLAGAGPEAEKLRGMGAPAEFPGELPPRAVRDEMDKADIFLFTSDAREGWGVVLNEAMNSGCAVVASRAAGSTPYLVRSGENGLTYQSGKVEELTECIRKLLEDEPLRRTLGQRAFETIRDQWTPEEAARRLLALCDALLQGRGPVETAGPCSIAPRIKEEMP